MYRILCFAFSLCFMQAVFAWNGPGHKIVAQIAYDKLTPTAKAAVDNIVKYMAIENTKWRTYTDFVSIATWPDDIKGESISSMNQWHYWNEPFTKDNSPLPLYVNPQNVIWAIEESKKVIANSKANPYDRARFLAFFIHFVGDIHQPLHCENFFSAKFPHGDEGGNLYKISFTTADNHHITELHALWDHALSLYTSFGSVSYPTTAAQIKKIATIIEGQVPPLKTNYDSYSSAPANWAKESYAIAKNKAYNIGEYTTPSPSYLQNNNVVVEHRLALAGYRLATELNAMFGNSKS